VLGLSGDLGSGKTTFVQGLAHALGIQNRIVSPTFILMRSYQIEDGIFYHIDTYRLDQNPEKELNGLGFEEICENSKNIVVVEWAEKVKSILPSDTIYISFEYLSDSERKIQYEEL
jgi:tRNA threonylcarbamoyladenosine biosynthesis protein TsaE